LSFLWHILPSNCYNFLIFLVQSLVTCLNTAWNLYECCQLIQYEIRLGTVAFTGCPVYQLNWLATFLCRSTLSMCVSVTNIMPNFEDWDKISGCILSICYCFDSLVFLVKEVHQFLLLCLLFGLHYRVLLLSYSEQNLCGVLSLYQILLTRTRRS
jgi:hypothetical protein